MILLGLTVTDSKQTLASVSKNRFPFNGSVDLGKSNDRLQEKVLFIQINSIDQMHQTIDKQQTLVPRTMLQLLPASMN